MPMMRRMVIVELTYDEYVLANPENRSDCDSQGLYTVTAVEGHIELLLRKSPEVPHVSQAPFYNMKVNVLMLVNQGRTE